MRRMRRRHQKQMRRRARKRKRKHPTGELEESQEAIMWP
jgi:hypothetical protein